MSAASAEFKRFSSKAEVGSAVVDHIRTLHDPDAEKFVVALSGGSLPSIVLEGLREAEKPLNTSNWCVLYADERIVPFDSPDSTHGAACADLLRALGVQPGQVVAIDPALEDADACAQDYADRVHAATGGRPVDLCLLGMGPDGHTASLFPGHRLLSVTDRAVAGLTDSPKPPAARVTLTLPTLNACRHVAFVVTGDGKADAVAHAARRAHVPPAELLPSARVQPAGSLVWFLDHGAAAKL